MRTKQSVSTLALTNKPRYTMGHFGEKRQMGGFLDDLWTSVTDAGDKALDKLVTDQQRQLTNQITKTLYNIVGLDGKTKQVTADSPEYQAYIAQNNALPPTVSIFEKYQKEIMIGAMAIGGILVASIIWKMVRPAPAPIIYRTNPIEKKMTRKRRGTLTAR